MLVFSSGKKGGNSLEGKSSVALLTPLSAKIQGGKRFSLSTSQTCCSYVQYFLQSWDLKQVEMEV